MDKKIVQSEFLSDLDVHSKILTTFQKGRQRDLKSLHVRYWRKRICQNLRYGLVFSCNFSYKEILRDDSSCPHLIIFKSALFRGLRVYELKFRSKKDNEIIFFFQWKLRCCVFQIWYPGGIQEASQNSILIWNCEIFQNFQKNTKFSNQNRASGGLLEASWDSDLEKGTSQLSLEKKLSLYLV